MAITNNRLRNMHLVSGTDEIQTGLKSKIKIEI